MSAKLTTPTFTSLGTAARKSETAFRVVAIPSAPIDPLVSMTSIVVRGEPVAGDSVTTADFPSTRAITWVVSIFAGSTPRMTSAPVTCPCALRRSLIVAVASADAGGAARASAATVMAARLVNRASTAWSARQLTSALRTGTAAGRCPGH